MAITERAGQRNSGTAGLLTVDPQPLTAWLLRLRIEQPHRIRFRHLRALAAGWVEAGLPAQLHRANVKPFTVSTLRPDPDGDDCWHLVVTTLSADAAYSLALALTSLAPGSRLELGGAVATVTTSPRRLAALSFPALLADATDASHVTLRLLSPTVFRSGRSGRNPFPVPTSMLGHYRARWNAFAPEPLDLDLRQLGLRVVAFQGASRTVTLGHRRADGRYVDDPYAGFVGEVTFTADAASRPQRRLMHALCSLAPFCGTGANTTVGMGMTAYGTPPPRHSTEMGPSGRCDREAT